MSRRGKFISESLSSCLCHVFFLLCFHASQHFPSNIHIEGINDGTRLSLIYIRWRCLQRCVSLYSSTPQINGSCAISRIVAVLFSHFRSIRCFPRVPACEQSDCIYYKQALSTRSLVPSGPDKRTWNKLRVKCLWLSSRLHGSGTSHCKDRFHNRRELPSILVA